MKFTENCLPAELASPPRSIRQFSGLFLGPLKIRNYRQLPIKKSAKKALRQNKKNRQRNIRLKGYYKKIKKEIIKLIKAKKIKEAQSLLPQFYKYADKAAKRGVIKKNTAARKKARLAKQITSNK